MIDIKRTTGTFPLQFTPFIGREREVNEIIETLHDPNCHMLTLVGAGGGGKTRLAIEVAHRLTSDFLDGTRFVALQGVSSPEYLTTAIADSLTQGLRAESEAEEPLLNYLSQKNMLLVLDNFEHLLSAEGLLTKIIQNAPEVKLLITSREVLNLREEWLYPVGGMQVPGSQDTVNLHEYGSIRLFMEHARRVKRDIVLEEEREAVIRICRAVEGMPLGLELAASWLRALPALEIANEIERGLDLLETNLRDVPERHRSMRAVFDQSWKLLSEAERSALRRLSVFQGGFDRDAARHIADASLMLLTSLVDKSMLRLGDNGRYSLHELLRQYANERLNSDAEEAQKARDAMDDYFVNLMKHYTQNLLKGRTVESVTALDAEIENMRVVWVRICQQGRLRQIRDALYIIVQYYDYRGLFVESERSFRMASDAYEASPSLSRDEQVIRSELYTWLGWTYIRLGKIEQAEQSLDKAQAIRDEYNVEHRAGLGSDLTNARAILAEVKGDFEGAVALAKQAIENATRRENEAQNLSVAYYALAGAERSLGQLESAKHHARLAYETAYSYGDLWFTGYCLIVQGAIARTLGDYAEAERCFQECYNLRKTISDPEGMGLALVNLGAVALRRGSLNKALDLLNQSVEIYNNLFDRGGLITALCGRGAALRLMHKLDSARTDLERALDIALEGALVPRGLAVLAEIGALLLLTDEQDYGVSLLSGLLENSSMDQETRDLVRVYLNQADPKIVKQMPPTLGGYEKLAHEAKSVLHSLTLLDHPTEEAPTVASSGGGNTYVEGMLDPLTEREFEILKLLAEGLTNQQIADRLVVVVGTIKAHNHSIFSKLGVRNRVQAVTRAQDLKLI